MNTRLSFRALDGQGGAVLPYVLGIVFFLSFLWILSLSRTTEEFKRVGSSRMVTDQFYATDAALAVAYEKKWDWLTDDFSADIESDISSAVLPDQTFSDENNDPLGTLTFRPIQDEDEDAAEANNLPFQGHEVAPSEGSGDGANSFVYRRFGITAISPDGSRQIQVGVSVRQTK